MLVRHRAGNGALTVDGTGLEDRIRRAAAEANLSRRFRVLQHQLRMIPVVVVGDGLGILDRGLPIATAGQQRLTTTVVEAERIRLLQGSRLQRWIGEACHRVMGSHQVTAGAVAVMIRVLHGSGRLIQHLGG